MSFHAQLTWLLARGLGSLPLHRTARDIVACSLKCIENDSMRRSNAQEAAGLDHLISSGSSLLLPSHKPTLVQCGRGHKGMNIRIRKSLGPCWRLATTVTKEGHLTWWPLDYFIYFYFGSTGSSLQSNELFSCGMQAYLPHSMRDLSSPTRNQNPSPASEVWSLNHWTTGKSLDSFWRKWRRCPLRCLWGMSVSYEMEQMNKYTCLVCLKDSHVQWAGAEWMRGREREDVKEGMGRGMLSSLLSVRYTF